MFFINVLEIDKSMILRIKLFYLIFMIVINKFKIREKKYWFIKIVKFEKKKK